MDAERRPCTARSLGGDPCLRLALPGRTKCAVHNGRELRRAERRLHKLTVPAVERIKALLASENESVALKAATTILDRTAGPVPRAVVVSDASGGPAIQIGFAMGGLVQAPTVGTLPEPAIDVVPEPDTP